MKTAFEIIFNILDYKITWFLARLYNKVNKLKLVERLVFKMFPFYKITNLTSILCICYKK